MSSHVPDKRNCEMAKIELVSMGVPDAEVGIPIRVIDMSQT